MTWAAYNREPKRRANAAAKGKEILDGAEKSVDQRILRRKFLGWVSTGNKP